MSMTREEFARIAGAIQVYYRDELDEPGMELYFNMLRDLPFEDVHTATQKVLCERTYKGIPTPAEIRRAVATIRLGGIPTTAQAWNVALTASKTHGNNRKNERHEFMIDGEGHRRAKLVWDSDGYTEALAEMPRIIGDFIRSVGGRDWWREFCDPKSNQYWLKQHFFRDFSEYVEKRINDDAQLPSVRKKIEKIGAGKVGIIE